MRSTLVFLLSSVTTTIVAFSFLMFLFMRYWGLATVDGPPPDTFPVLVWQSGSTCDVVLWGELKADGKHESDWIYIPQAGDLEECRTRLRPDASFEIQPTDEGRHHIELRSSPGGDEVNASRYWATPEHIEPISHQRYFGPLVAIAAAGASGLIGLVAGIVAVLRSRRRRRSSTRDCP